MRLLLTLPARADLAEAQAWYRQQGIGLSQRFVGAVDTTFAAVQSQPQARAVERRLTQSGRIAVIERSGQSRPS